MVRVELGVKRSIEEYVTPSSGVCYPQCRASRRASVGANRWVAQRTKRFVQRAIHPTASAILLQSR